MEMTWWGPVELALATDRAFQLVDLTDRNGEVGSRPDHAVSRGSLQVFCPHTSCGLAITELEDGLHRDIESVLDVLAPLNRHYDHDDLATRTQNLEPDERKNGWSHVRGLLATQPSVVLPITAGTLDLGQWQRVFLVELDGPRPRRRVHLQGWGVTGDR